MAAMFSIDMTGSINFSCPLPRNKMMVRGTKIIKETSFVTNIEVKNTPKIKNSESAVIVLKPAPSRMSGRKMFSFLKPSSTVSIIKSVPSVCQSIDFNNAAEGGVIKSDITAAITATKGMGSFFISEIIFFMLQILSQMKK